MKEEQTKEERVLLLAERLKLLFMFCGDLVPDKDLIEEAASNLGEMQSNSQTLAPILTNVGLDWQEAEFDAKLKGKRARALFHLIDTLDKTEKERQEFNEQRQKKKIVREELAKIVGLVS